MASARDAKKLHSLGWQVVAAPMAGKLPLGKWKQWQTQRRTPEELEKEFEAPRNIFIICGSISRLAVLDCDDRRALDYWKERLGSILDETTCASSGRGQHFYFRLAEGESRKGRSSPGGDSGKWDLRADGGGVVAPPSTHPNGKQYRWAAKKGPEALKDAPPGLWTADEGKAESGPKTQLSELLANPPTEGGRNNWLAKVAGHYAAQIKYKDAYEETVRAIADPLGLEEGEVEKLIQSIWSTEQRKGGKVVPEDAPATEGGEWRIKEPTEDSGWLVSGDTRVLVQIRERDEENDGAWRMGLAPWLGADMRTIGVFEMPDDSRVYHVEIRTPRGHREVDVSSKTIGNTTRLNEWLAGLGLGLSAPEGVAPRGMSFGSRMVHYLEAQGAPSCQAAGALGWHAEADGFLTHEGVLRADGYHDFAVVRPAPHVRDWAPYRYGLGDLGQAQETLREVLTFHFPQVAAVFGSWWAACLLKPQISDVFSQFPLMAIEAPSESGKSTGYFPMMLELAGNTQGKSVPTKAALRDYLSAHRNGVVWVDDVDDLDAYGELIRGTTVEGAVVKKGLNQHTQMSVQLHAALSISGESLGLRSQKALADRCVDLQVPSPVGRVSTRGDYPQWDDIVELKRKQPDLTDFAGTFVVEALKVLPELEKRAVRMRRGNLKASGRMADKISIVRLGAWLLERIAGVEDNWIREEVDKWAGQRIESYESTDNTLTTEILPKALHRTGSKSRPEGPDPARRQIATPVFITDKGIVWFAPKLLAEWWSDLKYGRIEKRVASEEALTQQAKACGAGGKKGSGRLYFEYSTGGGGCNYWKLPSHVAKKVVERSQGEGDR
jgi:hypothetical protein